METQKDSNGWRTFVELWAFAFTAIVAALTLQVLDFFMRLSGAAWICFLVASFALMTLGGGLIGYAKLPVYRRGRLFTCGVRSVPGQLRNIYCWGWRVFLFGVVLALGLLLSRP